MMGLALKTSCLVAIPMQCMAARLQTESEVDAALHLPYGNVDSEAHFECASEYTLGGMGAERLPDLLTHAHEWCRSDIVPEDKRVPEVLRGLFWMKGLSLSDVAFCGSLGEWDAETLTARLPVWSTFIAGKETDEDVPSMIMSISGVRNRRKIPMIYSLQFTNSSLKEAEINPNARFLDAISYFPMYELSETADGSLTSEHPGDIWSRPSFFFHFFSPPPYEAVRVMYDDGTLNMDRASAMRADLVQREVTYMRYAPVC